MTTLKTILFCLLILGCSANTPDGELTVEVEEGILRGTEGLSPSGREYKSFLGVPFARPPVGSLRFMPPKSAEQWEGIREANKMPEYCLQYNLLAFEGNKIMGQEDCLYLNVYAPKVTKNAALPVMVFIHGGGFFLGGAREYNPLPFMEEDVVIVIIQYRLGPFGFYSTGDSVLPGNYGLKDQTKALEWVQKNIHNFGGNPKQVTIFGESAGGASVDYHVLSPHSKGLFQRAIAQSGTALNTWASSDYTKEDSFQLGEKMGCFPQEDMEKFKTCMQNVDALKLLEQLTRDMKIPMVPYHMLPVVDGDYLPDKPEVLLKLQHYNKVDMMYGITRDEGALFTVNLGWNPEYVKNNFHQLLRLDREENVDGLMKQIYKKYFGSEQLNLTSLDKVVQLYGDWYFNFGQQVSTGYYFSNPDISCYLYELHFRPEPHPISFFNMGNDGYVNHATDLCFLFGQGGFLTEQLSGTDSLHLRDTMVKLWVNFARTGNPTPDDSLGFVWQRAKKDNHKYLQLQPKPEMKSNSREEMKEFWLSLPIKRNKLLFQNESTLQDRREEL